MKARNLPAFPRERNFEKRGGTRGNEKKLTPAARRVNRDPAGAKAVFFAREREKMFLRKKACVAFFFAKCLFEIGKFCAGTASAVSVSFEKFKKLLKPKKIKDPMKKTFPIVVSMLSAAATAFAGYTQDEAVGWYATTDSGYAVSDGLTVKKAEDGSITLTLDDAHWAAQRTDSNVTRSTFTFALTFDFDKITAPSAATQLVTTGTSTVTGVGLNTSGQLCGWWGTAAYNPILSANPALTGVQTVLFTFSHNGSRFYQNSDAYWSNTGLKGDIGLPNTITISAVAAEALTQFIGWTDDSCYSSTDDAAIAFQTASSLVIPEPSTFGLLAGVGALALVAARRRRRSRAK